VGSNVGIRLLVIYVDYAIPCRQIEREREREIERERERGERERGERERERERERSNGQRRPVYGTRIEHLELKLALLASCVSLTSRSYSD
jgi:hypothetical protein